QLDAERQAVEEATERDGGGQVVPVEPEARRHLPGAVAEQAGGRVRQGLCAVNDVLGRDGQARQRQQPLGLEPQALARGHERAQAAAGREELVDDEGGAKQVLELVEEQEGVPVPQGGDDLVEGGGAAAPSTTSSGGTGRPASGSSHSAWSRRRSREVASARRPRQDGRSSSPTRAAPSRCSNSSRSKRACRSLRAATTWSRGEGPPRRRTPAACATATDTPSGAATPARGTTITPSGNAGRSRSAALSARPVLPTPPGPTSVSRRHSSPVRRAAMRSSSSSRPTDDSA